MLPKMGFTKIKKPHLLASYKVAYCIAKAMKPHTLSEEVIKPCIVEMAEIILGEGAVRKFKQVALSNDTNHRRINDLIIDICNQPISDFKASPLKISLQLDESPDVSNYSQLICFVCFCKELKVEEEFLFCELLPRTTAKDVFKLVKRFFNKHNLDLKMTTSICTDGAAVMLSNHSGFATMLKKKIPKLKVTHCLVHRQALTFKTLPPCLKNALNSCVKIENYIRGCVLNHNQIFVSVTL